VIGGVEVSPLPGLIASGLRNPVAYADRLIAAGPPGLDARVGSDTHGLGTHGGNLSFVVTLRAAKDRSSPRALRALAWRGLLPSEHGAKRALALPALGLVPGDGADAIRVFRLRIGATTQTEARRCEKDQRDTAHGNYCGRGGCETGEVEEVGAEAGVEAGASSSIFTLSSPV
jgi:hypothetical protein